MDPGDVLYFHCNLLHTSGPNLSPDPRWVLIFCYNVARNNHFRESDHPFYTPLEKVEDNQIKEKVEKYFFFMKIKFRGNRISLNKSFSVIFFNF